jgi:hypothetical protein
MGLLVFGDIMAAWVFPALLGLLSLPGIWFYAHTGIFTSEQLQAFTALICMMTAFEVGMSAFSIGAATPHLRETPAALLNYLCRYVRMMFTTEVLVIGLHWVLWWGCQAIGLHGLLPLTVLCVGLGWLILNYWVVRTFLWGTLPTADPQLIRGQDMEASDDISRKAWQDE